MNFDYIIIGAGTAGCVLANRLSENGKFKVALFEATHGTAPKYAGLDKVNPASLILSAEMMLNHIGWHEASENIIKGISWAIKNKLVTYDLERLMTGAKLLKCSEFAEQICNGMS